MSKKWPDVYRRIQRSTQIWPSPIFPAMCLRSKIIGLLAYVTFATRLFLRSYLLALTSLFKLWLLKNSLPSFPTDPFTIISFSLRRSCIPFIEPGVGTLWWPSKLTFLRPMMGFRGISLGSWCWAMVFILFFATGFILASPLFVTPFLSMVVWLDGLLLNGELDKAILCPRPFTQSSSFGSPL